MGDFGFEYSYSIKCEGKWIFYKALLLLFYLTYTASYLFLIIKYAFIPLGALIPVTLWIIAHFTWRYTSPDYSYKIEAGALTLFVIYGARKKEKIKIHLKDASLIAPKALAQKFVKDKGAKIYSALTEKSSPDAYGIVFGEKSNPTLLLIDAPRDAKRALNYYNKDTVLE